MFAIKIVYLHQNKSIKKDLVCVNIELNTEALTFFSFFLLNVNVMHCFSLPNLESKRRKIKKKDSQTERKRQ